MLYVYVYVCVCVCVASSPHTPIPLHFIPGVGLERPKQHSHLYAHTVQNHKDSGTQRVSDWIHGIREDSGTTGFQREMRLPEPKGIPEPKGFRNQGGFRKQWRSEGTKASGTQRDSGTKRIPESRSIPESLILNPP